MERSIPTSICGIYMRSSFGDNPTAPVYEKLEKDIREMGYNCTKVNEFNFAEHGGHT